MKKSALWCLALLGVAAAAALAVESDTDHATHAIGAMDAVDALGALDALDTIEKAGEVQLLQTEDGHREGRRHDDDDDDDDVRDEEDDSNTDDAADADVSLGETSKAKTKSKTTDTTQGMFDADVRAERAFSSFDNEMSSLSAAVDDSNHGMKKKAKQMGDALVQMGAGRRDDEDEDDDKADQDGEGSDEEDDVEPDDDTEADADAGSLGEDDSAETTTEASAADVASATTDTTMGMYDAEVRATRALSSFDDTMSQLSAVVNDGESSLLQTGKGDNFGLDAEEMAMTSADSKLLDQMPSARADAEMKQWSDMSGVTDEDADAEKSERMDEQQEKDFGESADPVETAVVDAANTNTETLPTPGLTSYQKQEQDDALAFVNKQKAEENAVLAKAEAKEKATEDKATKEVMGDINMVKKTRAEAGTWHMKKSAIKTVKKSPSNK